jgi:hypothetical protein
MDIKDTAYLDRIASESVSISLNAHKKSLRQDKRLRQLESLLMDTTNLEKNHTEISQLIEEFDCFDLTDFQVDDSALKSCLVYLFASYFFRECFAPQLVPNNKKKL